MISHIPKIVASDFKRMLADHMRYVLTNLAAEKQKAPLSGLLWEISHWPRGLLTPSPDLITAEDNLITRRFAVTFFMFSLMEVNIASNEVGLICDLIYMIQGNLMCTYSTPCGARFLCTLGYWRNIN